MTIPESIKLAQLNAAYSFSAEVALIADTDPDLDPDSDALATWLANEVNYQGSARQSLTWGTATGLGGTAASVSFVPTSAPITCRWAIVINTDTNTLHHVLDLGQGYQVPLAGKTITYTPRYAA